MGCIDATSLTLFVENRLAEPAARQVIEHHIDGCASCRRTVAELARSTAEGSPIGRYVVSSELGAGGMGRVYLAHDPELDRRVAIKVLRHVDATGERDERMRREAQALARVTHPNVASIFDVGELDGHVFLAMEYVGGGTLSAWLAREPRTWREIVRVFEGAGRGLAAVHERGLVHRDFKPDNVLLDDNGVCKVTDFGLVAVLAEPQAAAVLTDGPAFPPITTTDALLGTPAYMAPEQFAAGDIDARTDQFSFCVALYEAINGQRPFPGETALEIADALKHPPREPPRHRAPRWLQHAILRGLAFDPASRFASMDELVNAISQARRQRRRLAIAIPAGIVVAGLAGAAVAARTTQTGCDEGDVETVWTSQARRSVTAALERVPAPFAADVAKSAVATLDRYADRWRAAYTQVCEATRVHGTQSDATMDRRMTCLSVHARELATLLDVLDEPTIAIAEHAVELVGHLAPIEDCDDLVALSSAAAPPADLVGIVERERRSVIAERISVDLDSGEFDAAKPLVDQLAASAEAVHDSTKIASARILRGQLELHRQAVADAAATFRLAIADADRAHDDTLRARSWALRIRALTSAAKLKDAEAELPLAAAVVERAGGDPELAELWDTTRGEIDFLSGRLGPAAELYEAAIVRARSRGDRRAVSELLHQQVTTMMNTTDPARTLPLENESLALATELYGPHHPEVAIRDGTIAFLLELEQKHDEALAKALQSFAVLRESYGPDHPGTAHTEVVVARMLRGVGRLDEARAHVTHALDVELKTLGGHHYWVFDALRELALIERAEKHFEVALGYQQRAHAILEELAPETDGLVASYHTIAEIDRDLGRAADADAALRAGLALGERIAPDNPQLGLFYSELGSLRLEANDARGAESLLERAVHQFGRSAAQPEMAALTRLDLAHAKVALGKWTEARDLAIAAKADLHADADLKEADQLIASTAGTRARPAAPPKGDAVPSTKGHGAAR